jgi:hypothetical protein
MVTESKVASSGPEFVTRADGRYAVIRDVDRLAPFLMTVVGDSDVWLFVGSNSPFTAGRVDPDGGIFPYQTADKILGHSDTSGAVSAFRVRRDGGAPQSWEPWGPSSRSDRIGRNLYKHVLGTSVIFEETNFDLGLRLSWTLSTCERFGLVRECVLENVGSGAVAVEYVDGFHMLLPPGVGQRSYAELSYLAAGYMRHEALPDVAMGVIALNSAINDGPMPLESLRTTCAWSLGLDDPIVALSERQLGVFRNGGKVQRESELRGEFGSFLLAGSMTLDAGQSRTWFTVVDTRLDQVALVDLRDRLRDPAKLEAELRAAVVRDRDDLRRRIAAADGLQQTADEAATVNHLTSVLFNCMRGGTFADSYRFPRYDLALFLRGQNAPLAERYSTWTAALPEVVTLDELHAAAKDTGDAQLIRICSTYLPLIYSRRHGDPSRPWNRFSIRLKDEQGRPVYGYEGNWRDIFQNWEALAQSQPGWLGQMLAIFLDSSTADGYNAYRITRKGGVEWEVPDPDDIWGNFGYWGDHQIVYLLRLLESQERFKPGGLASNLNRREYAYADVPYRIAAFERIVADPRSTVSVDAEQHRRLMAAAALIGADGKLVAGDDGSVRLVTLAEKLLVPVLVKLTNFVPDGGTWLNTQRPEWNDANNALAGSGLSVVTVNHARRYLSFCDEIFSGPGSVELSASVAELLDGLTRIYAAAPAGFDDRTRYEFMGALGRAGEAHRTAAYARAFGAPVEVDRAAVHRFIAASMAVLDATLASSCREDGLFHSYNLLHLEDGRARVAHMYPMLEGQVAALSSGLLDSEAEVAVLRALHDSDLYLADERSYVLYPDLDLPSLMDRNSVPTPPLEDARIFVRDRDGGWHFQADLRNAADVGARLGEIGVSGAVRDRVLDAWERTFRHREFTGRSRTFFMFEGLGSIYWHMVAKLLLAAQEGFLAAVAALPDRDGTGNPVVHELADGYDAIRDGLGFRKSAEAYGAFPCDPYSHTPRHRGAQQPGMTGLVKEEVLARWGELGVLVQDGCVRFEPRLLHAAEFSVGGHRFDYVDLAGRDVSWGLPPGSLGFTYCGTPICYELSGEPSIRADMASGSVETVAGSQLPAHLSRSLFARDGAIGRLTVGVAGANLRG